MFQIIVIKFSFFPQLLKKSFILDGIMFYSNSQLWGAEWLYSTIKIMFHLEMHKMQKVQGFTRFAKLVELYGRLHFYESDKTFYYTLWFCILKSLTHSKTSSNHPRSHQKFPRACIWDIFAYCPPPYFKWPFGRCLLFQKWKKTYQWSWLGNIDPKDYRNKGVS